MEYRRFEDSYFIRFNKGEEVNFNTNYCHGISPDGKSSARYDLSVYTDKLKEGEIYRISTYFFDESGNNYQVFAEFTCDNELAEKELEKVSGGASNYRENPQVGDNFTILNGNK